MTRPELAVLLAYAKIVLFSDIVASDVPDDPHFERDLLAYFPDRMEKKFEQIDHFEKVVTFARQGYGGMTLTVKGGTSKPEQREAWYQARKKLNDLRLELPEGVIGPIFNDEYGDVYGLLYAVKGDGIGQSELADVSEDVKRRLLKVAMVKKVDVLGKQAEETVELGEERRETRESHQQGHLGRHVLRHLLP